MSIRSSIVVFGLVLAIGLALGGIREATSLQPPAFGTKEDIAFAEDLWPAMEDYHAWKGSSDVYPGTSPHGKFLRLYFNVVNIGGESYSIIVKDNFGGEGVTAEAVRESPRDHLAAVTIMLRRESGYDPDNGNWFWVKYGPDGAILENEAGVALAGRVGKGGSRGCIPCHGNAAGGDLVFTNDE